MFKLKWYCNFCKRQCSDENGYKVHCSTFFHQAAMEKYNRDPSGNKSADSNEFLSGFCAVLNGFSSRQKLKKGSEALEDEWVDSNLVYQEYIKDRHHIHLSATRWNSVARFVRFMGLKGIAEIKKKKNTSNLDSDEKFIFGESVEDDESADDESEEVESDPTKRPKWFIKLIDKSPEAILLGKSKSAALKKVSDEEALQARQMALVEKRAKSTTTTEKQSTKIVTLVAPIKTQQQQLVKSVASIFEESDDEETDEIIVNESFRKKNLVLEKLAEEESKYKKERIEPVSYYPKTPIVISIEEDEELLPWIRKGLLIKIGNEELVKGKYLNLLAVIDEVIDDFGAQVTVLKSGDQLLLDQDDCLPVSRVKDQEFDQQLSTLDLKIMSTALKTNRCVLLVNEARGREGRVLGSSKNDQEFKVEISSAGSSQIHRKQFDLIEGQFCIYWE